MREVLKVELKKAFRSKGFIIALAAGIFIVVLQFVWFFRNTYRMNNQLYDYVMGLNYMDSNYGSWFETMLLEGWMGCECFSAYNNLFFLVFPLLAAVPYGISLCNEWRSGYAGQMLIRCGRKRYLTSKILAVFTSGGTAVAVPLLLSLLMMACFLPAYGSDPIAMQAALGNNNMWAGLFWEQPVLYALCYSLLDFVFGGIFACITLVCSRWLDNRFGAVMFPMLLNCTLYYGGISIFSELSRYNPNAYLNPEQPYGEISFSVLLPMLAIILVGLAVIYIFSNRRRDTIE